MRNPSRRRRRRRRIPLTTKNAARRGSLAIQKRHLAGLPLTVPDPQRRIPVGLSTSSVFPKGVEEGFRVAAVTGYDGVEVMVSGSPVSQDADKLAELSERYVQPILSLHAPTLFFLQNVYGWGPWPKIERTAALARELGVPTIVAHPPFRWQGRYAHEFVGGVRALEEKYGVEIAVENMYPWRLAVREAMLYYPHWNPVDQDYRHVTVDLSHAATAGSDVLAMIDRLGPRLRHLHLADGQGLSIKDEHLLPGEGNQPCAESLRRLAKAGWTGSVLVEVDTRTMTAPGQRERALRATVEFAREHLGHGLADAAGERAERP